MRELIAMNSTGQVEFLQDFIASWADSFVDAIEVSVRADFYKTVAQLWRVFLAVEVQAFDFE
jgi:TorA maturation chaperone TorD